MPSLLQSIVRHLAESTEFVGIGYAKAARLAEAFGADLPRILAGGDPEPLAPIIGAGAAENLVVAWRENLARGDVVVWLAENAFEPKLAAKVVDLWGADATDQLKANPYAMMALASFQKVDAAAQRLGVSSTDPRRLVAAVEAAMYEHLDRQHTWISNYDLLTEVGRLLVVDRDVAAAAVELARLDGAAIETDGGWQPAGAVMMEAYVAQRLREMVERPAIGDLIAREVSGVEVDHFLDRWTGQPGMQLDGDQRAAVHLAVTNRLSVVLGGAGVGKTTVLNAVASACDEFGRTTHMAALAGRAAVRISHSTGRPASTIAAFLKGGESHQIALGPESLLVVDEASMLDLPTMYRLLRLLPDGARLMLVGDPGQLPPIGFGLTFHVLATAPGIPRVELQRVYRQTGASGIPAVSRAIRAGSDPDLSVFAGLQTGVTFVPAGKDDLADAIVDIAAELGGVGNDLRILSAVKAGAAGVVGLNGQFHRIVAAGRHALHGYSVGEPVMFLKNDYRRDLRNGSLGIVAALDGDVIECDFDGQRHQMSGPDLANLSLAYAMTVHKSQGSQFRRVIVPVQDSRILDRTLIYTAVTRATDQVVLVGDRDVLRRAIEAPASASRRQTGLAARL